MLKYTVIVKEKNELKKKLKKFFVVGKNNNHKKKLYKFFGVRKIYKKFLLIENIKKLVLLIGKMITVREIKQL